MRRILVTGGVGFIGSCFVRRIMRTQPDAEVYVLDAVTYAGNCSNLPESVWNDPRFFFWKDNICNRALVNRLVKQVDAIVHFAAETHVDHSIYNTDVFIETDLKGTQILLDAVRHQPVERLIHISTSEVYGTASTVPMTEEHPLNPRSPYASAKCGADRLVYSYVATFGVPAVILRPFNNYGPYQHIEKAIPCFITQALQDLPLRLHGNGSSSRDWLYVEDCCEGIERTLLADAKTVRGEAINLGTGADTGILNIAEKIVDMLGKPRSLIQQVSDRPGQVSRHVACSKKARQLLGWSARTSLEEGLRSTVQWYVEHEAWWTMNTHLEGANWLPHAVQHQLRKPKKELFAWVQTAMDKSAAAIP